MDDRTGTPDPDVAYENTADEVWAQRARGLQQRRVLQVEAFDTEGVVSAQVWGQCPRCGHDLNIQQTLRIVLSDSREGRGLWAALTGRDRSAAAGKLDTVEVGCGCQYSHPGAPEQTKGCGVSFRLPAAAPDTSASPATPLQPPSSE